MSRLPLACALLSLAGCRAVFGMLDPSTETTLDGGDDDLDGDDRDAPIDPDGNLIDMAPDIDAASVTTNHPSNADSFTAEDQPAQNFSTQASALADGNLNGGTATVLIRFDLGAIPTNAAVTAAVLHLFTDFDPGGTCQVFQVLEQWDEGTVTSNSRSAGNAWTNPGVKPPTSRSNTVIGTINPNTPDTENVVTLDATVVAGWVANPATNFGIAIVTSDADGARFTTKEGPANLRPVLAVTHAP